MGAARAVAAKPLKGQFLPMMVSAPALHLRSADVQRHRHSGNRFARANPNQSVSECIGCRPAYKLAAVPSIATTACFVTSLPSVARVIIDAESDPGRSTGIIVLTRLFKGTNGGQSYAPTTTEAGAGENPVLVKVVVA